MARHNLHISSSIRNTLHIIFHVRSVRFVYYFPKRNKNVRRRRQTSHWHRSIVCASNEEEVEEKMVFDKIANADRQQVKLIAFTMIQFMLHNSSMERAKRMSLGTHRECVCEWVVWEPMNEK